LKIKKKKGNHDELDTQTTVKINYTKL